MNAQRTTYTVRGTLQGPIWWPIGAPASKTFEYRAQRSNGQRARDLTLTEFRAIDGATYYADDRLTMRELAELVMSAEDGDFAAAPRFMADTVLTVTRWGATGQHSRSFDLNAFPSLSDYTSQDWPVYEGED